MPDYWSVVCEKYRDLLSAMLDGEDEPGERARADAHLAECAACAAWWESASHLTRLARTGLVLTPPELPEHVLDAAPGPGRARLATALRLLLGALGIGQLGLGLAQVTGFAASTFLHDGHAAGAATGHLWHESAAWNVAVGAGFLFVALRRSPPVGIVPTLTAFVGLLVLLSASDALAGHVEPGRLVSHGLVISGYAVIVALTRPRFDFGGPPRSPGRGGGSWWRVRFDAEGGAPLTAAHVMRPLDGTATAHHRRAA